MHPICRIWFSHIPYKSRNHREMAGRQPHTICAKIWSRARTQNLQDERRNQIAGNTGNGWILML